MTRPPSRLLFLLTCFFYSSLASADSALYIFHGLSAESTPSSGVELVCLGRAPKFGSCQAARTTDGVAKKSVQVAPEKAHALLRKYVRLLKPGPRLGAANCRGSLSFTTEWNDETTTRALCPEGKRDRELTHILLKAEHAITGVLDL